MFLCACYERDVEMWVALVSKKYHIHVNEGRLVFTVAQDEIGFVFRVFVFGQY